MRDHFHKNDMEESHLNIPLIDNIDYTRRDEIVFGLMDVIKCPVMLDTTERMVIFNDQLYDREAFEHHRTNEAQRNTRRLNSGYTNAQLKCPRTGRNFPYDSGLRNLYRSRPRREDLFNMIL